MKGLATLVAVLGAGMVLWGCDSSEGGSDGSGAAGGGAGSVDSTGSDEGSAGSGGTVDAGGDEGGQPDGGPDVSEDAGPVCGDPTGERPARRSEHAGIYDPVGDQVVMFGGSFAVPENCGFPTPTFESETWIYDVTCDAWRLVDGAGPNGRVRHMAAFDSQRRRMIVFGGRDRPAGTSTYTLYDDLWALDLATETWEQLDAGGAGPSPRVNGAMVYDDTRDQLVLFGGNQSTSGAFYNSLDDVWTYSFEAGTWTPISAPGAPSSRLFTAALWDSGRQWMVIHGGADETAFNQTVQYFDDLYALDFSGGAPAWQRLDDPTDEHPVGRFWGGLVHDTLNDRYVLFGGHDNGAIAPDVGNKNDLWTFDPAGGAWTQFSPGDEWNKPANGFCSFPPDFTTVVEDFPERRNSAVFVASTESAFVTGGKTDCGVIDDLFRLDFEGLVWTELTTATVGEGCIRKGGLNCNDLCF